MLTQIFVTIMAYDITRPQWVNDLSTVLLQPTCALVDCYVLPRFKAVLCPPIGVCGILYRNDMGGRYCAINSPRGSRWGQKSRDRRSRDFCPHCGPSGELIAQYRPPMSFRFYPTLYLGNHLYFLKPDSSWKQQRNTLISEIDSVHSTKHVLMVTPQHLLVTS